MCTSVVIAKINNKKEYEIIITLNDNSKSLDNIVDAYKLVINVNSRDIILENYLTKFNSNKNNNLKTKSINGLISVEDFENLYISCGSFVNKLTKNNEHIFTDDFISDLLLMNELGSEFMYSKPNLKQLELLFVVCNNCINSLKQLKKNLTEKCKKDQEKKNKCSCTSETYRFNDLLF